MMRLTASLKSCSAVTLTVVSLVDYIAKNIHVIRDMGGKEKTEAAGSVKADSMSQGFEAGGSGSQTGV